MPATLADIRRFLSDHFSAEDLDALCFDNFPEVYRDFTRDMTTTRKGLLLLDYCLRRDRMPELLRVLRQERPEPFRRVFGARPGAADRRVNLNTATAEELRQLPGIGQALAAAIVEARPFGAVDELRRARGIGARRLAALREWCVV
jgi:competence ComEA-like helix-hairpin-helix protein